MTPEEIALSLSEAQRKLYAAASVKRGKSWTIMKRHAKLSPLVPLITNSYIRDCFQDATGGGSWQIHQVLSPLGLAVRRVLQERLP